jgi:hypothetical protein
MLKADAPAATRAFAEFITSARGQGIVAKLGHWLPETEARR